MPSERYRPPLPYQPPGRTGPGSYDRRIAAAGRPARGRPRRFPALVAAILVAACGSGPGTATPAPPVATPSPASTPTAPAASPSPSVAPTSTSPYASPGAAVAELRYPKRTVFVQLFEWRWPDVATECEQWLGPHGFAAVQISPPQEHALIDDGTNHFPWWERYQAVSYRLESRSGTRAEFADMVARCRAVGVDVYADAILNHMAAGGGTGSAGTQYTKYRYPGLYEPSDFHAFPNAADPGVDCTHGIVAQGDPTEIQTCELSGLADLRTEDAKVQATLAAYLADLWSLGVRGYRIDAAKHIAADQLAAILQRLRARLPTDATFFVDEEVVDLGGGAVPTSAYTPIGSVDDFVFNAVVTAAFLRADQAIGSLRDLASTMDLVPPDRSVTFIDSHDIQRGRISTGLVLTYKRQALHVLANTFLLAWPGGYPRVMSGYVFSDTEAGPPSDATGRTNAIFAADTTTPDCGLSPGQWVCEQRWHAIAGMVGFRDFTADQPTVTNWWSNPSDANQIAFGRGSAGFVVINRSANALMATLATGLAAGTYCDVVAGDLAADGRTCTGPAIAVAADGTAVFNVPPMESVAIHVGAKVAP